MSVLGPGNLPAIGLAGSAAAGQHRTQGLADRDKADQSIQKLDADRNKLANRDLDDSIETDFSHGQVSDRDPDGRLPWQQADGGLPEEGDIQPTIEEPATEPRAADAEGDRGRSLDVDA